MPGEDLVFWLLVGLAGVGLLSLLGYKFFSWLRWFKGELRYLNREIRRTRDDEKAHFQRRKKRLLKSLLPFVKYR